jgi:hypothetical protein
MPGELGPGPNFTHSRNFDEVSERSEKNSGVAVGNSWC